MQPSAPHLCTYGCHCPRANSWIGPICRPLLAKKYNLEYTYHDTFDVDRSTKLVVDEGATSSKPFDPYPFSKWNEINAKNPVWATVTCNRYRGCGLGRVPLYRLPTLDLWLGRVSSVKGIGLCSSLSGPTNLLESRTSGACDPEAVALRLSPVR